MDKYKNKDGISLNYTHRHGKDIHQQLVKEVVGEAIKMCKQYNMWERTSCQIALHKVSEFLKVNFDIED